MNSNDDILVIYLDAYFKREDMQRMKEQIKKDMSEGLVILPCYAKPVICPKDIEVRFETEAADLNDKA